MRVVQISVTDKDGGGGAPSYRLHRGFLSLGIDSTMYVMRRMEDSADGTIKVFHGRNDIPSRVTRFIYKRWISRELVTYKDRIRRDRSGFIYDRAPEGRSAISQMPPADVIYIHGAIGFLDYYRDLPILAQRATIVFVLHDMSFFTGGCTHAFDCERFVDRCGTCPLFNSNDERDVTRRVWQRKHAVFSQISNRLHFVAPSQWIAREAKRSGLLRDFPVEVIPLDINAEVFRPRNRSAMRELLGIPQDAHVVGFLSNPMARAVRIKGFSFLLKALEDMSESRRPFLVTAGGGAPPIDVAVPHKHLGQIHDSHLLSALYSAADIVALPSLVENLPRVAMEAMACGTPVVAFATGGIPEIVRHGVTGLVIPKLDTVALRLGIDELLQNPSARAQMAENSKRIALEEYSMPIQAQRHAELCTRITS